MCTVTYLPLKGGFVLTSSRDEKTFRPTLKPQCYPEEDQQLVYPKDLAAGGTWIAASNKKRIACLLNGGFHNHKRQETYSKSRGRVVLETFSFYSSSEFMERVNLSKVEPFTLLLIDYERGMEFNQLIWDGHEKHVQKVDTASARIWSSATLYSEPERNMRSVWFENWLIENNNLEDSNIFNFHSTNHSNFAGVDILMKRENGLQTVSISQFRIVESSETFNYFDLSDQSLTRINLSNLPCIQDLQ